MLLLDLLISLHSNLKCIDEVDEYDANDNYKYMTN